MYGSREMEDDPGRGEGCFFRNSRIRIGDLTDGSSNTLMVGERTSRLCKSTWTGFVVGAVTFPVGEPDEAEQPYPLILGHTGMMDPADPPHTPNGPKLHAEDFASNHSGGVNFLQGDGSVRMIRNSISPAAWVALGTRAGGEVIQDD
jgi:prepilin-type processing-associated H-X9-DG protein